MPYICERRYLEGAAFDVVVLVASLGGRTVIERILAAIANDFPAPIVVCTHMHQQERSLLPHLLSRYSKCPVASVANGEPLRAGTVYVSIPGHHTTISPYGRLLLNASPRVNFARPSADVLLESASAAFGPRTLGVILTGGLHDGAQGALAVVRAGGVMLAQDPKSCEVPGMPRAAIERKAVHMVLPPDGVATAINALVRFPGIRNILGLGAAA